MEIWEKWHKEAIEQGMQPAVAYVGKETLKNWCGGFKAEIKDRNLKLMMMFGIEKPLEAVRLWQIIGNLEPWYPSEYSERTL